MSLHQTRTMQVFDKTCTTQSVISFSNPLVTPHQPPSDAKKIPFDHKSINPMLMG